MRTPLRQAAQQLRRNYRKVHFSETFRAERGLHWPPRKRRYPWPIMRKSGTLANSYMDELIDNMKAKVYTKVPYAWPHHTGAPSINLPMRRTMTIIRKDVDDLKDRIKKHLRLRGIK